MDSHKRMSQESCNAVYGRRPAWAQGMVSLDDARYLFARVLEAAPDEVVEIGTSSGVSAAILCTALSAAHQGGEVDASFRVASYDLRSAWHVDPSRQVGDAIPEMLGPDLASHVVLRNPATALTLRDHYDRAEIEFLFVDANHRHPWPALDLLATLDLLRPGAEVILHDINLPVRKPQFPDWGAKYVFDDLAVEKFADSANTPPNIGSLIVPADKGGAEDQLRALVAAYEWEAKVPDDVRSALGV